MTYTNDIVYVVKSTTHLQNTKKEKKLYSQVYVKQRFNNHSNKSMDNKS